MVSYSVSVQRSPEPNKGSKTCLGLEYLPSVSVPLCLKGPMTLQALRLPPAGALSRSPESSKAWLCMYFISSRERYRWLFASSWAHVTISMGPLKSCAVCRLLCPHRWVGAGQEAQMETLASLEALKRGIQVFKKTEVTIRSHHV